MATKQDSAIALANQLMATMQSFAVLLDGCQQLNERYVAEGYNSVWEALSTAPLNTDGSLGTADGSPNSAHPIDVRVVTTLNRAVSANQLIQGIVLLEQFGNFMTNGSVTQGNYQQSVADLIG